MTTSASNIVTKEERGLFPDAPASRDALQREDFIKSVVDWATLEGQDGHVIGLEGEWGTGKSTLLEIILDKLGSRTDIVVVKLNPWMVSGSDALVEFILTQLAASIEHESKGENAEKVVKLSEKILGYAALLKSLKYAKLIPGAGWIGEIATTVGESAEKLSKEGKESVEAMRGMIGKLSLSEKKKELAEAIAGFGKYIVVSIDDLDRLTDDEIKTTFQAIKAVADFPKTTYLLSYDPGVVARALHSNEAAGAAYLEKIVQVAHPVPQFLPRQSLAFLQSKLGEIQQRLGPAWSEHDARLMEQAQKCAASLCRTPRHVIRLVNRFAIFMKSFPGEINPADVLVLEALAVRFPRFWKLLGERPGVFVPGFGTTKGRDPERYLKNASFPDMGADMAQRGIEAEERDSVDRCLEFLFPVFLEENRRTLSSASTADLRVQDDRRFLVYLTRTLPRGEESAEFYRKVFADTASLQTTLDGMNGAEIGAYLRRAKPYLPLTLGDDASNIRGVLLKTAAIPRNEALTLESADAIAHFFLDMLREDANRRSRLDQLDVRYRGGEVDDQARKGALLEIETPYIDEILAFPLAISSRIARALTLWNPEDGDDISRLYNGVFEPSVKKRLEARWSGAFVQVFGGEEGDEGATLRWAMDVWVRIAHDGRKTLIGAVDQWCRDDRLLDRFLSAFPESDPQWPDEYFRIIPNADAFIERIASNPARAKAHANLLAYLRSEDSQSEFHHIAANRKIVEDGEREASMSGSV
ncbi:KAP family P-loop NTPase fold protein [Burkholderia gladioli]|uniref:KAP family P-loop NTPase fold protein n=1 Tax=Burkholderia gladioli TaxID=28095 RepID=UPI001640088F|nr:P-loop NTPase fold protein [Burkholderia gladioli]